MGTNCNWKFQDVLCDRVTGSLCCYGAELHRIEACDAHCSVEFNGIKFNGYIAIAPVLHQVLEVKRGLSQRTQAIIYCGDSNERSTLFNFVTFLSISGPIGDRVVSFRGGDCSIVSVNKGIDALITGTVSGSQSVADHCAVEVDNRVGSLGIPRVTNLNELTLLIRETCGGFAPTPFPTTKDPTEAPTKAPTTLAPTEFPSETPTKSPTDNPTFLPTENPTKFPTTNPTASPTIATPLPPNSVRAWQEFLDVAEGDAMFRTKCSTLYTNPCDCPKTDSFKVVCDEHDEITSIFTEDVGFRTNNQTFPVLAFSNLIQQPTIMAVTIRGDVAGLGDNLTNGGCVHIEYCTRKICDVDPRFYCPEDNFVPIIVSGSVVLLAVVLLLLHQWCVGKTGNLTSKVGLMLAILLGLFEWMFNCWNAIHMMFDVNRLGYGIAILCILVFLFFVNLCMITRFKNKTIQNNKKYEQWTNDENSPDWKLLFLGGFSVEFYKLSNSKILDSLHSALTEKEERVLLWLATANMVCEDIIVGALTIIANSEVQWSPIAIAALCFSGLSLLYGLAKRWIAKATQPNGEPRVYNSMREAESALNLG